MAYNNSYNYNNSTDSGSGHYVGIGGGFGGDSGNTGNGGNRRPGRPYNGDSKLKAFYYKYPILSTIVLICLSGFAILIILYLFTGIWTHHGATSTVPDVKGMGFTQATDVLRGADLDIVISDSIYSDSLRGGTVVEMWPKPGAVVKAGREVYLSIVAFSPRMVVIDMPLTDISVKQAENYLASHGVTSIRVEYVPGEYDNSVVGAKVDGKYVTLGSRIPANSTVVLEVSRSTSDLDDAIGEIGDSIYNAEVPDVQSEPQEEPEPSYIE